MLSRADDADAAHEVPALPMEPRWLGAREDRLAGFHARPRGLKLQPRDSFGHRLCEAVFPRDVGVLMVADVVLGRDS